MDEAGIRDHKWHKLLCHAWIFEWIPFVDFVLVGGSLAIGNAHAGSDWDVVVVAAPRRTYVARGLCLALFRTLGLRTKIGASGDGFCFNHFLASGQCLDEPHGEYAQRMRENIVPIVGDVEKVWIFLERSGAWRMDIGADLRYRYRKPKIGVIAFVEWMLSGAIGSSLEYGVRTVQMRRMWRQLGEFGADESSRITIEKDRAELCFHPKKGIDQSGKAAIILHTMMTIQPIGDRVFLEAVEENRVTKSGIFLPETAEKERPVKGRVVAVGPGKRSDKGEVMPLAVKVGDTVLFKKYGPDEVEIDGKKYLAAEESDILAILKD